MLHCSLWGEDLGMWLNPDDSLYGYSSKFFPDATPASPENVVFDVTVGVSLLEEDWGADELYALLTRKNLYTDVTVQRKSNVVMRSVGPAEPPEAGAESIPGIRPAGRLPYHWLYWQRWLSALMNQGL